MVRNIILALICQLFLGSQAFATAANVAQTKETAARLEQSYLRYLEAQLAFWRSERFGKGEALIEAANGHAPDLEKAEAEYSLARQQLEEITTQAHNSQNEWLVRLSEHIRNSRKAWDTNTHDNKDLSETSLKFLREQYSASQLKKFSPLHWQALRDIYGVEVEENFLRETFAIKHWETSGEAVAATDSLRVVWIVDPWQNINNDNSKTIASFQQLSNHSLSASDIAALKEAGFKVDTIAISDYSNGESQAAELLHHLRSQYLEKEAKILILSSGQASAIVYQLLDLNPELRENDLIVGWINWNGRLHGMPLRESLYGEIMHKAKAQNTRALASVATPWELTPERRVFLQLTNAQLSLSDLPLPLGHGFAIWSLVPEQRQLRTSPDLHEAVVNNEDAWLVTDKENTLVDAVATLAKRAD